MTSFSADQRIGLALSGGGVRAAVFHLGVLKRLAADGNLEKVSQISTVSGGSLVMGAIFSRSRGQWPSSEQFLKEIYPSIRGTLVSGDLLSIKALGIGGIFRKNIRILFSRANILAELLERRWGIDIKLSQLPRTPVWHINTTCIETGKNWRFSRGEMGDWMFGRHFSPDITVAKAVAASAAVPYVIGALKLSLPEHGWWQTDPATKAPLRPIKPSHRSVRLWDGGAYENMALEALYKPQEGLRDCDILMCSDASGPLREPSSILANLLKGQLASPRLFDISSDQIRSLRSRMLINSIRQKEFTGFLFRMGTAARTLNRSAAASGDFLSDEASAACLNYPTNLTKITEEDFDRISRHGFEVAQLTMSVYGRASADVSGTPAGTTSIP
jgi:NTE family protein